MNRTYDGEDVLLDDANGTQTKYLNGPGIDNKLRSKTGGTANYYLADHLGSTNALTDSNGAITASQSYDAFGNATNASFQSRYQFTGREFDSFTGLQFSRARFYDPQLGRFISEDPIGFGGGDINLYGYVGNRPLARTDPLGLFPIFWPWNRHQEITRRALTGSATQRQLQSLTWANENFDRRTQDLEFSPQHAMRLPGQSPEEAKAEANRFVRSKICAARVFASRGWNTDAMHQLAEAMHTVQDANSPTHKGFQESWPFELMPVIRNVGHYIHEALFPGSDNLRGAEDATRLVWDNFNGSPMPNDYFSNSGEGQSACTCTNFDRKK